MELDISGFSIRDAADLEQLLQGRQGRWDYIDEDLLALRGRENSVTFYLPPGEQGDGQLAQVMELLSGFRARDEKGVLGRLAFEVSEVEEESWENSWKQYYKPIKPGEKLVVCPTWEDYDLAPGEVVIRLDPGMAFGTGTHSSTQLCLRLLEKRVRPETRVLDLGCGSGILALSALLLGANRAFGVDIDDVAVRVARENAALNGVAAKAKFERGNLAEGINERYGLILINITADIILPLIPDLPRVLAPGGEVIASGIISSRAREIGDAMRGAGFTVAERLENEGWVAFLAIMYP